MPSVLPGTIAKNLRDGLVTERQKLTYVILLLLMQAAARLVNSSAQHSALPILLYTVVGLLGTMISFRTNARGDNRHFIERWLCLHFSLDFLVVYVPQFFLYATYVLIYWSYELVVVAWFQRLSTVFLIFNVLLLCLNYWLLNHFIRIAASGSSTTEAAPFAPIAAP